MSQTSALAMRDTINLDLYASPTEFVFALMILDDRRLHSLTGDAQIHRQIVLLTREFVFRIAAILRFTVDLHTVGPCVSVTFREDTSSLRDCLTFARPDNREPRADTSRSF